MCADVSLIKGCDLRQKTKRIRELCKSERRCFLPEVATVRKEGVSDSGKPSEAINEAKGMDAVGLFGNWPANDYTCKVNSESFNMETNKVFSLGEYSIPYIDLYVCNDGNLIPACAYIDTGAYFCMITEKLANYCGLKTITNNDEVNFIVPCSSPLLSSFIEICIPCTQSKHSFMIKICKDHQFFGRENCHILFGTSLLKEFEFQYNSPVGFFTINKLK